MPWRQRHVKRMLRDREESNGGKSLRILKAHTSTPLRSGVCIPAMRIFENAIRIPNKQRVPCIFDCLEIHVISNCRK